MNNMDIQNKIEPQLNLPENILAEKIVLASIIQNSDLIYETFEVINYDIFSDHKHQEIYKSITETHQNNETVDFLSIANWLTRENKTEYIPKLKEIEKLGRTIVNNQVFEEYLYLLIDKFLRRSLITSTLSLLNIVADEMTSIGSVLNEFEKLFLELNGYNTILTSKMEITSLLPAVIKGIEEKFRNNDNNETNGLESGFADLDTLTDGFQKSDLIIIASRPGMGKTAFVLNIAKNITKKSDNSIVFFSLEMTAEQLSYRILASESKISLSKLKKGEINSREWQQIQVAVKTLANAKLYIDDTPKITISKLRSKIYQILQRNGRLNAVVIDYLQLIEDDQKNENRYQALSSITRSLKIIAREFNIPLLVLSQLSRNLESRTNKRPILADLRESGCLSSQSYVDFTKKYVKIKNINLKIQATAFALNSNSSIILSSIKKIYKKNNKIRYHLLTGSGYWLEASGNHRILTKKGWKALNTVHSNDSLALAKNYKQKNIQYWTTKSHFLQIQFEKIESIYIYKKDNLFDLEMNKIYNFIANNIVVHNSIEQDADLVCMLYREDYYNTEKANNRLAEVAILKHRNGPTGKVTLKFNNNFAEFTDNNTP
uniref:Replicative DNA helicase n=1 Tax=Erythrotrichia carnea TaxID=35151 RepID=A0A1C9CEI9_9RHOD|nr:replication helicase subunit [Erythrotrichia carnea]AOM66795.1 replication helicase subunit [Erythrotrichia carnea]